MYDASVVLRSGTVRTPWCATCQLRQHGFFADMSDADLAFMREFKSAHGRSWAGELLIEQGGAKPRLLTLYSGWAIKTGTLPSGETHLLAVMLPGDLVGLESVLCGAPRHSVEAVTDVTYCTLEHRRIDAMLGVPSLARRIAHVLLYEQRRTNDRLAVVAACSARRNLAHFLLDLHLRLRERGMAREDGFRIPLTSTQIASALGLTTVHLNRVLRSLRQDRILTLENHVVSIHDLAALREVAALCGATEKMPAV